MAGRKLGNVRVDQAAGQLRTYLELRSATESHATGAHKPMLRLVRIEWDPPLAFSDALKKDDPDKDYGVYLIEGHNLLYGCKGALYLGQACDQCFADRLKRYEPWLKDEQDVSIRLGRLRTGDYEEDPPQWSDWFKLLGDVEALTIRWHGFPYNSEHIASYSGQPLRVQNWGHRGNLQAEYSSDWLPLRPSREPEN
jgi:hypothetical protein